MARGKWQIVCFCALMTSASCTDVPKRSPIAATPPPVTTPGPVPSVPTYTISGVVSTTDGVRVAGARVAVLGIPLPAAVTDANGAYTIAGVIPEFDHLSPLLSASSAGFFTDVEFANRNYAALTKDVQLDFRLAPVALIAVGQVVDGELPLGDAVCSHWGYGASPCQRYGLEAPASGALEVTLSSVFIFDFDVIGPDGAFVFYNAVGAPQHVTIPVDAGATYEVRVIGGWSPPRTFTLTTALR